MPRKSNNPLNLDPRVFTWSDPMRIALSLKHSAEKTARGDAQAFKAAMTMLAAYVARTGKNLDTKRKSVLDQAKRDLKILFGKAA